MSKNFSPKKTRSFTNVAVIVKETYLEKVKAQNDTEQLAEIYERKPGLETVLESHRQHTQAVAIVVNNLEKLGLKVDLIKQESDFATARLEKADLVVTVGGDGTMLRASQYLRRGQPIVGVNSAPKTSFGHYCLSYAADFERVLFDIHEGFIEPSPLLRLKLTLDGEQLEPLVLNEILITHQHPAGTSRYQLTHGRFSEQQRGSGLIISTPAGSTGFLRSEGGRVLPITDQQWVYQERAPCLRLGEKRKLSRGLVNVADSLTIISQMQDGKIYLDG